MMTTNNSMKRRLTVEHIIVRASMVKIIYSSLLSNDRMRCWNWKNIAQKCPSHAQHNLSTSIKNNNPFCVGFFPYCNKQYFCGLLIYFCGLGCTVWLLLTCKDVYNANEWLINCWVKACLSSNKFSGTDLTKNVSV